MRRATEQTNQARTAMAMVFAFAAPSLALGQAFYWFGAGGGPDRSLVVALQFVPISLIFGALAGWPFVLVAVAAWIVLAHVDHHHAWAAGLVGLAVGCGIGLIFTSLRGTFHMPVTLFTGLGLLTALGVWWIAYGRQDRLPANSHPRSRLVL